MGTGVSRTITGGGCGALTYFELRFDNMPDQITDLKEGQKEIRREMDKRFEIHILRGVVSKDHAHILVSALPNISPSDIMRRLKR